VAGTSFATPIVSGIAGLIKTVQPSYNGWSMMNAIQSSATPIGSWVSYGKVDAAKALTIGTDTTPPASTGISPANGAKVRGTITVTPVKLTDNWSGIRNVALFVDGVFKGWSARTAPYAVRWNSAGRNGPVKLSLRIYDKAGNVRWLDRWITADNTPPTVKITKAPKSGSKIKGTVKIYYTGYDKYGISRYQLLVNGKVIQTHKTTKYPFTVVASKYPKKSIKVQVRVYDVAGNSRITSTRTYHR
jgi:archaellum component FlaF (FlaF/FlaG flagellin family)